MDEELLISVVGKYPELYDPNYDDDQRRNNIWQEIEEIMKQKGNSVITLAVPRLWSRVPFALICFGNDFFDGEIKLKSRCEALRKKCPCWLW